MIFLAGIGAITLFVLMLYLTFRRWSNKDNETERLRQLMMNSRYGYEFDVFREKHPELPYDKALREFFDRNRMTIAQERERKNLQVWKETEDEIKREKTKKRVFGYSHELFLFHLFSPLAELYNTKWRCRKTLPIGYVLTLIEEEYKLDKEKAKKLFEEFVENQLLEKTGDKQKECKLGFMLDYGANIINDSDLNMDKYIRQFGKRLSIEELHGELEMLTPTDYEDTPIPSYAWSTISEQEILKCNQDEVSHSLQEMKDQYGSVANAHQTLKLPDGSEFVVHGLLFGKGQNSVFAAFSGRIGDPDQFKRDSHFQELSYAEIGRMVWDNREQFQIVQKKDSQTGELLTRQDGEPVLVIYPKE